MLLSIDLSISVNIVLLSLVPPLYQHFFYFFAQSQVTLNGAGATFPFPLIDTWRVVYQKVHPNVNINYQSIGSGGGVKQFTAKTVDFGASDAPLTAEERQAALGAVQIPEAIGSVAVAYNIPGIPTKTLKFTGPVLADIFQGKITKWNDPQIQALNPGVSLPAAHIVVVHRSDGSGTTYVWTSYLSDASPSWNQTVGASKSVPWTRVNAFPLTSAASIISCISPKVGVLSNAYLLAFGRILLIFFQLSVTSFISKSSLIAFRAFPTVAAVISPFSYLSFSVETSEIISFSASVGWIFALSKNLSGPMFIVFKKLMRPFIWISCNRIFDSEP